MNVDQESPDTIVLVHGLWMTPRSWENWATRYESRGYRVLTPAYPGFEVEVEALRATHRRSSASPCRKPSSTSRKPSRALIGRPS